MKHLFFYLFLMLSVFGVANAAESQISSSCTNVSINEEMGLSNCADEEATKNIIFQAAGKAIAKRNFEYAGSLFSKWINISSDKYPDNQSKNTVIVEPSKQAFYLVVKIFGILILVYCGYGLYKQQQTGTILVLENLFLIPYVFGGGYLVLTNFFDLAQILAACGVFLLLIVLSVLLSVVIPIFSVIDTKAVQHDAKIEAEYVASAIIDDLAVVYINDVRNRKRLIGNYSVTSDFKGHKITDDSLRDCFDVQHVKSEGDLGDTFIPEAVMNSDYCARNVSGFKVYEMGKVQINLRSDESVAILNKIRDISERVRLEYAYAVERNNCALSYQSIKDRSLLMYSSCMDMKGGSKLNLDDGYIKLVSDKPVSDESLKSTRSALVKELSGFIYEQAIKGADDIKVNGIQKGVDGITQFLGSGTEFKREYQSKVSSVLNSVFVNTDVTVKRDMLNSFVEYLRDDDSSKLELGKNNDFGVLDYASKLNSDNAKVQIFRTVNIVSGGAASKLGFNYEDCFNKENCAVASPNALDQATESIKSFMVPAFGVYVSLRIWESVANAENEKIVNTNQKLAASGKPAGMISSYLFTLMLTICVAYLILNYKLYGRQIFRVLDWLMMTVVASFTLMFALFGFMLEVILHRKINPNYLDALRSCGFYDILFRPLLLCLGWVTLIIMMYISSAINSILIYKHVESYVDFMGTSGVVADTISMLMFYGVYAFAMIAGLHKTITTIDDVISEEDESLFEGLSNTLNSANSVFNQLKGLRDR
ncbi:hypothetical protein V4100_000998 [Pseudomonas aeruginosa]